MEACCQSDEDTNETLNMEKENIYLREELNKSKTREGIVGKDQVRRNKKFKEIHMCTQDSY